MLMQFNIKASHRVLANWFATIWIDLVTDVWL